MTDGELRSTYRRKHQCKKCAYFRRVGNMGCGCHYLLDTNQLKSVDEKGVCRSFLSKADKITDVDDLRFMLNSIGGRI